jgi:ABC-type multidrug transport system fused ATPase/permease subunit
MKVPAVALLVVIIALILTFAFAAAVATFLTLFLPLAGLFIFFWSGNMMRAALIIVAIYIICLVCIKARKESYHTFSDKKVEELRAKLISAFPAAKFVKLSGSNESFTLDKKHIHLCIKDKNGKYYDDNSLMYVLLHEYAHVLCDEFDTTEDHGEKFKGIFADLLTKAHKAGIYDANIPMTKNYCGYRDA